MSLNADPHLRQPYIHEWSFDVESQLSNTTALEIRYVGSSAIELSHFHFFGNQAVPGPGDIQKRRLYPDFGFTAEMGSGANANYNGLQVQLTRRMSQGLNFLAGYTWAKQITNNEGEEGGYADGGAPLGQNDNNQIQERAPGVNNVRHRFTLSTIYELPVGRGRHWLGDKGRFVNGVIGNWELTSVLSFQTGFPITPQSGFDFGNVGTGNWRPDRICDGSLYPGRRTVEQWFNTSCYTNGLLQADNARKVYRFGNSGRSLMDGPGLSNSDLALLKDFHVSEQFKVQFRAEFFNAFNQAYFNDPVSTVSDPNFGKIFSAHEPRDVQFGLKFLW
jgi:hypothetical protein